MCANRAVAAAGAALAGTVKLPIIISNILSILYFPTVPPNAMHVVRAAAAAGAALAGAAQLPLIVKTDWYSRFSSSAADQHLAQSGLLLLRVLPWLERLSPIMNVLPIINFNVLSILHPPTVPLTAMCANRAVTAAGVALAGAAQPAEAGPGAPGGAGCGGGSAGAVPGRACRRPTGPLGQPCCHLALPGGRSHTCRSEASCASCWAITRDVGVVVYRICSVQEEPGLLFSSRLGGMCLSLVQQHITLFLEPKLLRAGAQASGIWGFKAGSYDRYHTTQSRAVASLDNLGHGVV